jgi:DNA-binding transcriptional regulator YiaG
MMLPAEVKHLRKRLGLTQSKFAALVGVHLVTVKKWEVGLQSMRRPTERLIRLLADRGATVRQLRPKRRGRARKR